MTYVTRNSTYRVDGLWIRASRGGNPLCSDEWKLAKDITDTGQVLVVMFPGGEGFASSRIVQRR